MTRILTSTGWKQLTEDTLTEEQIIEQAVEFVDAGQDAFIDGLLEKLEELKFELSDEDVEDISEVFKSKLQKIVDHNRIEV